MVVMATASLGTGTGPKSYQIPPPDGAYGGLQEWLSYKGLIVGGAIFALGWIAYRAYHKEDIGRKIRNVGADISDEATKLSADARQQARKMF